MNKFRVNLHPALFNFETGEMSLETKNEYDQELTNLQSEIINNAAGNVAAEVTSSYADFNQLKIDRQRFGERLKEKNSKGVEYSTVWDDKIKSGYERLLKKLEENKYFVNNKNLKPRQVRDLYDEEVKKQYKDNIWFASNKKFNEVKDILFSEESPDYPVDKIYSQLTGAATTSRVDRTYTEGYRVDVLNDVEGEPENLSDRQNRNFLSDDLPRYLWDTKKALPGRLNWIPLVSVKVDKPSKEDRKAINKFLKASSKIKVDGKDRAVALLEVLHDNELNTDSGKDKYMRVLSKHGVTLEKEKYIDDIMEVGNFYIRTQSANNSAREQHAIYLSVLSIIENEGGVQKAVDKLKPMVEQAKKDKKLEKKQRYETGENLDPNLKTLAEKLGITNFTSVTRLSKLGKTYFQKTPEEKILANLNNDGVIDARDVGGSKTGAQFLEIFNQVGKETALKNLLERAKLDNKVFGLGLDESIFTTEQIKEGNTKLILLLQNIIGKPGEDLYSLLSRDSNEDPFKGINLEKERDASMKYAAEMAKKMDLEALNKDGLRLPTPESMQSGLATALYTEYKRGIGLGGKVSFDEWIKGVEMNTGFQVRDDGTVIVGIGLDYSKRINLGRGWSTTPELSAGAFIPLGMGKIEKVPGSVGLNNEIAKERITSKGIQQHLGLSVGATLMPAGVTVLSAGLNRSQDKLEGIEPEEQKKKKEMEGEMKKTLKNIKDKLVGNKIINLNDEKIVATVRDELKGMANRLGVNEKDINKVVDATLRLLLNYNKSDLNNEGVIDLIAQGIAEEYAMAWAEDRKAHITDKAYLSGANLGVFWVAGSPLVGVYAGLKFTKHDLDGYGDRWGRGQELSSEYQGEWNQEMLDRFNQQLGLSDNEKIGWNGFIVIPASFAHRVKVNPKMKGLMKKGEKGNTLLDAHTPMSVDIRRGAATQGSEIIIGGNKLEEGKRFAKLDTLGNEWFKDNIDPNKVLELGEGIEEYNLDILNKAIADLNKKIPGSPIPALSSDEKTTKLISDLNAINTENKKAKIRIINNNGKIEFQAPVKVEGSNGTGLELEYESNFEMIDSKAKEIADAVYAEALRLNNPRILNAVKHDKPKHRPEYDSFNVAMQRKDYQAARHAIKPIFAKLDKQIAGAKFTEIGQKLDQIQDDVVLGQALMSIDNIFARSARVVGKGDEYTFPREGAEGMSKIIADREKGISKTIENYFKNDSTTKDAYLALIEASKIYRTNNLTKFKVSQTKAEQLSNTVGFNLGDKTDPERPLFNPEIYQEMIDLNSSEFQNEALKKAKNTIHKRAMEKFANNEALISPILKALGLEGKNVRTGNFGMDGENGKLTLDILNENGRIIKSVTLSAGMKFGYFTQCVNHTIILDNISVTDGSGTSVTFNSGVWDNGHYVEGKKSTIVSTTEVGISGSIILSNEGREEESHTEPGQRDLGPVDETIPQGGTVVSDDGAGNGNSGGGTHKHR